MVKIAQLERVVDFPPELGAPWLHLQRNFGLVAEGGNVTSNFLLNFNTEAERAFKITVGMSDLIQSSEDVFSRMFYDIEKLVRLQRFSMLLALV